MARYSIPLRLALICALAWLCEAALPEVARGQTIMSVQVKQAQLRETPSFLGKILRVVPYTAQVEVIDEQNAWRRVRLTDDQKLAGWIHSSALTRKRLLLKAGSSKISQAASREEVALAGKGFNADVEEQLKKEASGLNYEVVNRMEALIVSEEQKRAFLRKGAVLPEGGDVR